MTSLIYNYVHGYKDVSSSLKKVFSLALKCTLEYFNSIRMYVIQISVIYACTPFTKYLCYSLSAPVHLRMK